MIIQPFNIKKKRKECCNMSSLQKYQAWNLNKRIQNIKLTFSSPEHPKYLECCGHLRIFTNKMRSPCLQILRLRRLCINWPSILYIYKIHLVFECSQYHLLGQNVWKLHNCFVYFFISQKLCIKIVWLKKLNFAIEWYCTYNIL